MPMDEVHDATQLVARYYGCASSASMSSTRYEVWIGKNSKRKVTSGLKLESSKLLGGRISKYLCRRQHYKKDPRKRLPIYYDWGNDEASKSLLPFMHLRALLLRLWVYLTWSGAVLQLTSYSQMLGPCVQLLKCHSPFSVGVMELKIAVTDQQKGERY